MPRLVFLSDTHTLQGRWTNRVIAAKADILVHCGDFSSFHGTLPDVGDFADWCAMLLKKGYVKHIIAIAGNHDEILDPKCRKTRISYPDGPRMAQDRLKRAGVIYLQDEGVKIAGLRFYGTPWVSYCGNFAFQTTSPGEDEEVFNRIREPIDVLITHDAPLGIRDGLYRPEGEREHLGSPALLRAIERVKPRVHAFGHIHSGHGISTTPFGVLCINAASLDGENNCRKTDPVVIDLEAGTDTPASIWETGSALQAMEEDATKGDDE